MEHLSPVDSICTGRNAFLQILLLLSFLLYTGTFLVGGWLGHCTLDELSASLITLGLSSWSAAGFFLCHWWSHLRPFCNLSDQP